MACPKAWPLKTPRPPRNPSRAHARRNPIQNPKRKRGAKPKHEHAAHSVKTQKKALQLAAGAPQNWRALRRGS